METIVVSLVLSTLSLFILQADGGANFLFGGEARRVCEAYKMICPAKKICALQSIEWPRAMKFPVCVHEKHLIVKSNICKRPPQPGICRANFMRWYFNVHAGACSWFTYSGCGGNDNNFRTREICEQRCMTSSSDAISGDPKRLRMIDSILDVTTREPRLILAPAPAPMSYHVNGDDTASFQKKRDSRRRRRQRKRKNKSKKGKGRWRKRRNNLTTLQTLSELRAPPNELRSSPNELRSPPNELRSPPNELRSPPKGMTVKITTKVTPNRKLTPSSRKLTPLELGPNFAKGVKPEAGVTSRGESDGVTTARAQRENSRQQWLIDSRFRWKRNKRRRRLRVKGRRLRKQRKGRVAPRFDRKSLVDRRDRASAYRTSMSNHASADRSSDRSIDRARLSDRGNSYRGDRPTVRPVNDAPAVPTNISLRHQRRGTTAYYDKLQLFDILEKRA